MIKAIFLAAGQSKRIKYENKLVKRYKKTPLINHSLKVLHKSKVNKVIIVLGHQHKEVKKIILKNKKNIFIYNKDYKKGMASSIKVGLKKVAKNDKGFIVVQSDMPFIKLSDINKIYNEADEKLNIKNKSVFIEHVKGYVGLGEISIIIAVACPHRSEAYNLSRYIIEEIKKRSPIWKKEHYENNESEWLKGNPIQAN